MTPSAVSGDDPEVPLRAGRFLWKGLVHASLVYAVIARMRDGRPALEVCGGSGTRSALLSRLRERVVTVDPDGTSLRTARTNLERFGRGVHLVEGDLSRLPFGTGAFAVGFSQGLIQHLDDDEVGEVLRDQLRVADAVVFSVPSPTGSPRIGDPISDRTWEDWNGLVHYTLRGAAYRVHVGGYRFDPDRWRRTFGQRGWGGPSHLFVSIDPVRR